MGLLQPDTGLLFWMLICFLVVFVVLAKFGFPIITKMVKDRNAYIERSLDAAKEANKQLDNIKSEGEQILIAANDQQMKILKEAEDAKNNIIVAAREQARKDALKELEIVREQIRLEKEGAIKEIRRQVAVLSVDIAEKIIRSNLTDSKEQMNMIDRLIDESMVSKN